MKRLLGLSLVLLIIVVGLLYLGDKVITPPITHAYAATPINGEIGVWFSPNGGCTDAIVNEILKAQKSIRVQAYSFTSEPIASSLIEAYKRGVDIEIILDRSQESERYSQLANVKRAGIPTFIDSKHAIAHNKIMIIDDSVIITGSFNFTKGAEEKNAENLLIIRGNQDLTDKYIKNYLQHKGHVK
jgi:phosphatidylserine/phosphatidylglycerophosphate/cardiolipin synthase-like enzyme